MCGGHTLNRMVREAKAPRNETISHMDFWGEEGSMPEEEQMQRLWLEEEQGALGVQVEE